MLGSRSHLVLRTPPTARITLAWIRGATTVTALFLGVVAASADASDRTLVAVHAREADHGVPRSIYLVLRLGERRLHVMKGDDDGSERRLDSFPVAIGRAEY